MRLNDSRLVDWMEEERRVQKRNTQAVFVKGKRMQVGEAVCVHHFAVSFPVSCPFKSASGYRASTKGTIEVGMIGVGASMTPPEDWEGDFRTRRPKFIVSR